MTSLPPSAVFFLGAVLAWLLRGRARAICCLIVPVVSFANMLSLHGGAPMAVTLGDLSLTLARPDDLARLFGVVFHLATFLGALFMFNLRDRTEFVAGTAYAGAAIGTIYAGDLFTFFVHWELQTLFAAFLLLAPRTKASYGAALRYVLVHAVGGLILLAGIMLRARDLPAGADALAFVKLLPEGASMPASLSSWCIFIGMGINCGWPILHAWLPDSYPHCGIGGIIFLSTFTTKTAVYALARGFPGAEPLIWIGMAMTTFPIFYAVIENDLRRVLVYSMINQIGFMVIGIGYGTAQSLNGAVSHAFNDILFKGLLFMSVTAVMFRTGKTKCTDLGGLYKSMPITAICCIVGAASISAFPLFSGFVSKSMIISDFAADGRAAMTVVWFAMIFASAGVMEHAGIKIPFFAFFGHDAGHRVKEAPWNMLAAMGIAAVACVALGTCPGWTVYALLPQEWVVRTGVEAFRGYEPYTMTHVVWQLELLLFAALAVGLLLLSGNYPPEIRARNLDADWLWRRGATGFVWLVDNPATRVGQRLARFFLGPLPRALGYLTQNPAAAVRLGLSTLRMGWLRAIAHPEAKIAEQEVAEQRAAYPADPHRGWPVGITVLGASVFLLLYLALTLWA